jgi:hypothetical protein
MNRMNLARHISVLWRFRAIVGLGLILGIAMAFLAAYKVPSMERRGVEKWSAESSIFVTQEGFPWGRVTLGDATAPGMPSASTDGNDGSKTPFADPARFANLALVYSNLVQSDEVRGVLPGHPTRDQIEPRVLDATGGGVSFLPIIKLTVFEGSANGAVNLNRKAIAALRDYIERNQQHTNPPTPANERIRRAHRRDTGVRALAVDPAARVPAVPARRRGDRAHHGEPAAARAADRRDARGLRPRAVRQRRAVRAAGG